MKLRTTLAGLSAVAIALSGLMLGGVAANAAPGDVNFVPNPIVTTDAASETANYNAWHFSPTAGYVAAASQANGLLVTAGTNSQWIKGNGNNGSAVVDATSIASLASSMSAVTSDPTSVTFQIPVFFGDPAAWSFTTLRKNVADTSDVWTTSRAINSTYGADSSGSIGDLVTALGADARAIAAGVLVSSPAQDTLVSSFQANYETTHFYSAPVYALNSGNGVSTFVPSSGINPDETTYAGWHQGVAPTNPALGSFTSVQGTGHVLGLDVTGKSQILYGYAPADRPQNSLYDILSAGFSVQGTPAAGAAGFEAQIPLFFFEEGVIGQKFTTLRAAIPANGVVDDSTLWAASSTVGAVAAGTYVPLNQLLSEMSSHEVLGHGFFVEAGSVLATSVIFNGHLTAFSTPAPVPATPAGPEKLANTGAGDNMAPMVGIAALALLTLGGVTLAARRRLQH